MKVLKVLLLLVILVLLFLGLTALQAGMDGRALLSPNLYLSALKRSQVFEAAPDVLVTLFQRGQGEAGGAQSPPEEQAKVEAAIRAAADPKWLEAQVEVVLNDLLLFLRGEEPAPTAVFPVGELGDRFLAEYAKTGNPLALEEFRRTLRGLPEELSLAERAATWPPIGSYVRTGTTTLEVVLLVWLGLALACFPLAGGVPGGARWIGTAVLLSGLLGVVGSLLAGLPLVGLMAGFGFAGAPDELSRLAQQVATSLAGGVLGRIRLTGLTLVGIAMVLYVLAAVWAAVRASRRRAGTPAGPPGATRAPGPTAETG